MPKYSHDVYDLLYEEDVRKMFDLARNENERVLISLLWLTGARPQEILMLTPSRFKISPESFLIQMPTLKIGRTKRKTELMDGTTALLTYRDRPLTIPRVRAEEATTNPAMEGAFKYGETIIKRVYSIPNPETRILNYTVRWAQLSINRLGMEAIQKKICPYTFRHSFFYWYMQDPSHTMTDAMNWKGALTSKSVDTYIRGKPKFLSLNNVISRNRSRGR